LRLDSTRRVAAGSIILTGLHDKKAC
jgi:hypothetical protein